eukprot:Skav200724  [mRNA]  locus=scaffold1362:63897:64727:+ [translate_table: standard]
MVLMHKPYTNFMSVSILEGRIILQELQSEPTDAVLAIFDEAQETFRTDSALFGRVPVPAQQKMILSDMSQSSFLRSQFPEMRKVTLTQVVGSTERIVLGAGAFQPQDSAPITCVGTTGPPLKTFLFPTPAVHKNIFALFAQKTLEALQHILAMDPSISFEKHVAMIVPNEHFYTSFKSQIEEALKNRISFRSQVLSFEESLSRLPGSYHRDFGEELFILDSVDNAMGLQKLFVLVIGFDQEKTGDKSRFHHAITRAQLQAVVVDRLVRGGLLEFLG